jgi:hypothetical protein
MTAEQNQWPERPVKIWICPKGHVADSTVGGVCWACNPGGLGSATQVGFEVVPISRLQAEQEKRKEVEEQVDDLRARVALKMDDADADVLRAESQREAERAQNAKAALAVERERARDQIMAGLNKLDTEGNDYDNLPFGAVEEVIDAALSPSPVEDRVTQRDVDRGEELVAEGKLPGASPVEGEERTSPIWARISAECAINRHDRCDNKGKDGVAPCTCSCHGTGKKQPDRAATYTELETVDPETDPRFGGRPDSDQEADR